MKKLQKILSYKMDVLSIYNNSGDKKSFKMYLVNPSSILLLGIGGLVAYKLFKKKKKSEKN